MIPKQRFQVSLLSLLMQLLTGERAEDLSSHLCAHWLLTFDFLCCAAKIKVNGKWLVGIFYAALNSSMWQSLPHQEALALLNDLCFPEHCHICAEQKASCPQFTCESFVSKSFASSMTPEETFPWFDLTAAQLRESPFSQLLEKSESVQNHLALLYQASFGDWPVKQHVLTSTKTSPTLAITEPGMMLVQDSSLSTAASKVFSGIPEETTDYVSKSS